MDGHLVPDELIRVKFPRHISVTVTVTSQFRCCSVCFSQVTASSRARHNLVTFSPQRRHSVRRCDGLPPTFQEGCGVACAVLRSCPGSMGQCIRNERWPRWKDPEDRRTPKDQARMLERLGWKGSVVGHQRAAGQSSGPQAARGRKGVSADALDGRSIATAYNTSVKASVRVT